MKVIRILVSIVSSRYLLAITAFTVWITFFDESNLFVQRQRTKELNDLNKKIEYYKGQVDQTKQELNDLQNDPVILEKYAREKYFMKRDNEEVFIIDSSALGVNPWPFLPAFLINPLRRPLLASNKLAVIMQYVYYTIVYL